MLGQPATLDCTYILLLDMYSSVEMLIYDNLVTHAYRGTHLKQIHEMNPACPSVSFNLVSVLRIM